MLAFLLATAPTTTDPLGIADALPDKCAASDRNEIVVCGSPAKDSRYRLPKLDDKYEKRVGRLETTVAGKVRGAIHVDPVELSGGAKSNRLMISIATSF
jgi:hypothetical protein